MDREIKHTLNKIANLNNFPEQLDIKLLKERQKRSQDKKAYKWKFTLAFLSLIVFMSGVLWNFPSVKAAVTETVAKGLNFILADNFETLEENLEKMPKTTAIKGTEIDPEGYKRVSYMSGNRTYSKRENGDFSVSDGKLIGQYDKSKNTFTIWNHNASNGPIEKDILKEMNEDKIKNLGTDTYLGRKVEKYVIEDTELWFDTETKLLLRDININGNERIEDSKLIDIEFDVEVGEDFFKVKPPKGAKVIEKDEPY